MVPDQSSGWQPIETAPDEGSNVEYELVTLATISIAELLAFHRGWVDAQNGHWSPRYEVMSPEDQVQYECGRLLVVNTMKSGRVPVWRGDRHTAVGPVSDAIHRSILAIGWPLPDEVVAA